MSSLSTIAVISAGWQPDSMRSPILLLLALGACSNAEAPAQSQISHSATVQEIRVHNGTREPLCIPAAALEASSGSIRAFKGESRLPQDTFAEMTVSDFPSLQYYVVGPNSDAAFPIDLEGVRGVPTRVEYSVPIIRCSQTRKASSIGYLNSRFPGISSEPLD